MSFRVKPVVVVGMMLLCMLLAAGSFYVYFRSHAGDMFRVRLSALMGKRVQTQHIQAEFPSTLLIKGLSVDGVMDGPSAKVVFDVLSLFGQDVRIRLIELDSPVFYLTKNGLSFPSQVLISDVSDGVRKIEVRSVIVSTLVVHDATIKVKQGGQEYVLSRVECRAFRVPLTTTPARTEFFITASLNNLHLPFVGNFLKFDGWVNAYAHDMDAKGKIIDDVGRVGLELKVFSRQNDMVVAGSLRLVGSMDAQGVGKKMGLMEDMVLNTLSSTDTDVDLGFSFQTKMDHMTVEKIKLSGQITTGLNSEATSGNIVAGLKALGAEVLGISPASL